MKIPIEERERERERGADCGAEDRDETNQPKTEPNKAREPNNTKRTPTIATQLRSLDWCANLCFLFVCLLLMVSLLFVTNTCFETGAVF